jgi:polyferredoxin
MEEDIKNRLDVQDEYLLKIYKSVEKTRKYFRWTLIVSIVMFFIPLLGLIFILPSFLSSYSSALGGL